MIEKTVLNNPFQDIIDYEYHGVRNHEPMPIIDRAAQFAPFAALTGYESAIKETARLTDERVELDEAEKSMLDEKLRILQSKLSEKPEVEIKFFQPDERKSGGAYVSIFGVLKKFSLSQGMMILEDGTSIPIDDILEINGSIFNELF